MKRVGLYVRVSTQEQKLHGMSVDAQIDALEAYCRDSGYIIHKIYNDAGISARKSYKKRPALLEMLRDCEGKCLDLVLFTRLDRFFRSVPDYYECMEKMHGVPWKAILEDFETTSPDGVFKVNIMLSLAQAEAEKTSARVKDSYVFRKARGDYYGRPPIGYLLRDKKLIKDPETEKGINAIFSTYLSTFSTSRTLEKAAEYGIHETRQNIWKILKNPTYTGTTKNGHVCDAYITEEDHRLICSVKKARRVKATDPTRVYLFSGLIVCGYCGKRLAGHFSEGKYFRYTCNQYHIDISEMKMERYLLTEIDTIIGSKRFEEETRKKGNAEAMQKKTRLAGKMERLKDLYINGDIVKDEYLRRKMEIERDMAGIQMDEGAAPELPKEWKAIYKDLKRDKKAAFWKRIIKQITITNETKNSPDILFH